MSPENSPLKLHLEKLTNVFRQAETLQSEEILTLDAVSARTVLKTLKMLTQQAGHLELEVSILRDSEAGKLVAHTAEQLATGELASMLDVADSNVIRYDFGGKNHDR